MTHKKHLCKLSTLFALACFATLGAVAQSSAPRRITQAIEETKIVTLKGHVIPVATAANDLGPVVDSFDIDHMQLVLQRSAEQEQALNQLMEEQNDRTSPNFHHWLTAAEFGEQFGVAQEDIDTLTSWLESHGFRVNKVYTNRMLIDFSGTAGQLQDTFHTSIHQLDVNGEAHIANMSDPWIPAAFAPVVKGFASLNDIKPHPMMKSARQYTVAGCSDASPMLTEPGGTCYFITPQDTETIYNLNPLYSAGISGQGQTIYLVEDTDVYNFPGDWNTYRSAFGLTGYSGTFTESHPGGCTDPGTNADDGEAAIDVEVASSVAPSAAINLISCPSGTVTFGGQIALLNLINANKPAPTGGGVISVSYGICEAVNGNGGNALFYNTYQQAASEGYSVFASSGDEGPSSCSNIFTNGTYYDQASLGVTGWGETPYNVSVGGTDFEDTYNVKKAGASFSTYWNATNTSGYGSAKSYIPEIPWNDSCASALISEVLTSSFTPYGASPAACNNATYDTDTTYLSTGAASGGASNCATGAGGTNQGANGMSDPGCQGYAKPSWQSVYGVPSDGVRDIPDVSMFAANGVWGHYEVVCWTDPNYTSDGATANCTGAPSSWSGFGGTSVSAPTMAAIQALVNQKTGETWGNPNPIYYQIAQSEYGTQGGTFAGSSCNSSGTGGPASGCVFNDITQGDIDLACEYNGTTERAHCYLPSSTHGVDSTDNVTAATVIFGGSGYTTAPTCTIAAPTNAAPYKSPTGTTLWAGGTQATCTATTNSGTTTAVWTVVMHSTSGVGDTIILTNPAGTTTCGPYTLSGTSTTAMATNLASAIGTACSLASESRSGSTVTLTAKAAGAAGNFITEFGPATIYDAAYVYITNTTKGQGPNYVSGITINTAGTGYQPETPITLTGAGSGAIAVANTSVGTAASAYQPAYGAAPGYDLATGLGSPNAYNLVEATAWLKPQTITFTAPTSPVTYGVSPTTLVATGGASGNPVTFSLDATSTPGAGSLSGTNNNTLTVTGVGTIVIDANQAGNGAYAAAPQVQHSITVEQASVTITASSPSVTYGSGVPTITASFSAFQNGQTSSVLTTQPTCTTTYTASSNVGSSPTTSCTGAAAANYTFTYKSGTVTVNPASVTITASSPTVTYGSAVPTITPSYNGFQNGQTSSVLTTQPTCTTTYTVTSNVGSSPTTSCSGAAATNYTFTYNSGTVTVNPASVSITASSPAVTYGTAVPTIMPTFGAFQNGQTSSVLTIQPTCTTTYTVTSNVGSNPTTSCSGAAAANYTFTYNSGTVKVNPASVSITASSPAVTYGSAVPTIMPTFGAFQNGQTSSVLTTQPICSTTYTVTSNVGSSPTTSCSGAAATNYTFTYNSGTVTVNPASVSITASSPAVTYGSAVPTIMPTFGAFQNGQTSSVLTTQPTCTTTYTVSSNVGSSPTTSCTGAAAANYTFSYNSGTVTVNPASVSITASSPAVTYGSAVPTITPTFGAFQNGQTSSVLTIQPTCTTTYTVTSNVGSSPTTSCSGAAATNYTFTYNSGTVTVTPASATINVTPYSVTYDGNAHSATATATGVGSVNLIADLTLNTTHTNVGTYNDSWSFVDPNGNYASASANITDTITQASSTVSVTCPASVTYNGTAQTPCTASVTGAGGLNQSLTVNYSNNTSAGSATASATFAGDANHTGNSNSGGFTINPASVTATAGSYSGVYDGSTHALSVCQVAGAYTGSLICTNNPAGPVGPGVGSGTITPSLSGDTLTNYSITSNSGSWSITQASSTVSVTCPASVTYNGTAQTPCTASVTGAGGLNQSLTVNYSNNTSAGSATASATFAGDANHTGNSNSGGFTINPASVTATAGSYSGVYDGSTHALSVCQVAGAYTGSLICTNNPAGPVGPGVGSGTITPSLSGDTLTNYSITSNSGSWSITQASSTVSVTCPASVTYNGTAQTPCTASVTGAGGLNQSLTVNYSNNTSAGSATASATFAGDANHTGNSNSGGFTINPASVTATAGSYSGVYDGSTHALSVCQVAGAYTGSLICTNNPAGPVGPGVGSGTITPSLSGDTLTNYSITSNSGSWSITQALTDNRLHCQRSIERSLQRPVHRGGNRHIGPGGDLHLLGCVLQFRRDLHHDQRHGSLFCDGQPGRQHQLRGCNAGHADRKRDFGQPGHQLHSAGVAGNVWGFGLAGSGGRIFGQSGYLLGNLRSGIGERRQRRYALLYRPGDGGGGGESGWQLQLHSGGPGNQEHHGESGRSDGHGE